MNARIIGEMRGITVLNTTKPLTRKTLWYFHFRFVFVIKQTNSTEVKKPNRWQEAATVAAPSRPSI
jgi:hypothetical protein